jgi:hypothetical protein
MNTISSLLLEIRHILKEQIIQEAKILDSHINILKVRLYFTEDLFIQIYRNDKNNNTSFTLISEGSRLYARDEIEGYWHKHPFKDPNCHDTSINGTKEVTLTEFYHEVLEILIKENII